jgi:putative membrane protein
MNTRLLRIIFWVFQVLMLVSGFFAYKVGKEYLSLLPMLMLSIPAYLGILRYSDKRALYFLILISLYATAIEATSVLTGFPYGFFEYSDVLGTKIADVVPWAVSFGWVPLVIGAGILISRATQNFWLRWFLGVVLLVSSDLVLDPGAVALEFWTWIPAGIYYTVPLVNYFGWLFSSTIGLGLFFYFFSSDCITRLPNFCTWTLIWGNMFWIGVTLTAGMYGASIIGLLYHVVLIYLYTRPKKIVSHPVL